MTSKIFSDEIQALYEKGELSEVVSHCQQRLRDLRATKGDQHPELGIVLNEMAYAYYLIDDFRAATQAKKESLEIDLTVKGNTSHDYIIGLCDLGMLYRCGGQYAEAELALEHALELVEKLPPGAQHSRSFILIGMAKLHAVRAEYAQAEQRLLAAAKQRLHDYNWTHPEFGMVYEFLSRLYWTTGKRLAAERAIQKALRIYREASHTENASYAMMLAFLGDIQVDRGQAADAKASYGTSLELLQRVNASPLQIAMVQDRLAKLAQ